MRPDAVLPLLHQTPIPSSTLWLGKLLPPPPAVIRILCYFLFGGGDCSGGDGKGRVILMRTVNLVQML